MKVGINVDFNYLDEYDGQKVGVWHDTPVYAVTSKWLKANPQTDVAFVVYDDGNKFVFKGKVIGVISGKGQVQEETRGYHYDYFKTSSAPTPTAEVKVRAADIKESTVEVGIPDVGLDTLDSFFSELSAPIDEFLATAAKAQ